MSFVVSVFRKALIAVLMVCFSVSFAGNVQAASYSINKGDLLSIYVYRQEDMNVKVRVDNSGFIRFPVAGRINVIGKTPNDIERIIAGALRGKGFAEPEVVVSVESYAPRKVFVLGEIKAGADFSCTIPEGGEMTAMQAISAAGGLAPSADVNKIVVRRNGSNIPVPAKDILLGKGVRDVQLNPSDTIIVPKAKPVSVLGAVNKPGEFYISPETPMKVSLAVALAGGAQRPNSLSKIRVTRGAQSIKVDIQSLLEDGEGGNDMELLPGDIVYVPETRW